MIQKDIAKKKKKAPNILQKKKKNCLNHDDLQGKKKQNKTKSPPRADLRFWHLMAIKQNNQSEKKGKKPNQTIILETQGSHSFLYKASPGLTGLGWAPPLGPRSPRAPWSMKSDDNDTNAMNEHFLQLLS